MIMRYVMGIAMLSSLVAHAVVQHVNTTAEFDSILNSNNFVIAKFGAEWCGPCRESKPKFEKISNQYSSIPFVEIDTDRTVALANRYDVRSLPTFIFFKNGKEVTRFQGAGSIELVIKDNISRFANIAPSATARGPVPAAGNVVKTTAKGAGEVVETTGRAAKGVVESVGDFFGSLFGR